MSWKHQWCLCDCANVWTGFGILLNQQHWLALTFHLEAHLFLNLSLHYACWCSHFRCSLTDFFFFFFIKWQSQSSSNHEWKYVLLIWLESPEKTCRAVSPLSYPLFTLATFILPNSFLFLCQQKPIRLTLQPNINCQKDQFICAVFGWF